MKKNAMPLPVHVELYRLCEELHLILLTSILPYYFFFLVKIDRKLIYGIQINSIKTIRYRKTYFLISYHYFIFHYLHNRQYRIEHLSTPLKNNHSIS